MSVEVWYGSKPHHEAEQQALLKLYQYLHPQQEHFVLLHNFFAGQSNEIDLVVLKRNGVFLGELKHVWNSITGGREGDWKALRDDGSETVLNPNRPNPFKQVQRNYYSWKEWCQEHAAEIGAGLIRSHPADWTTVMTYIILYPDLPADSRIDIGDWPVQAVGLPSFLTALMVRSSNKVTLSRSEMSRIPQLIGLQQWQLAQPTEKLSDWQPALFAVLAARGHALSAPLFRLDEIDKEIVTIGRESKNELLINAPTVSRYHAEMHRHAGRWVVRDLNSTSGTFVSYSGDPDAESRVQGREFALKDNSIVRFGPAAYTLLLSEDEVP
ncbi:MAG: FHA domain-containing protein [Chloroflexota bacterium]|nr:FHA domain-containing protein [Chloroflexota bacterium]